jgi:hypothetical protein
MAVTHRCEFVSQNIKTEFPKASDRHCAVCTVVTKTILIAMYLYNTQCLTLTAGYKHSIFTCPTRPHVSTLLGYPRAIRLCNALNLRGLDFTSGTLLDINLQVACRVRN